jgi:hypothetical protein
MVLLYTLPCADRRPLPSDGDATILQKQLRSLSSPRKTARALCSARLPDSAAALTDPPASDLLLSQSHTFPFPLHSLPPCQQIDPAATSAATRRRSRLSPGTSSSWCPGGNQPPAASGCRPPSERAPCLLEPCRVVRGRRVSVDVQPGDAAQAAGSSPPRTHTRVLLPCCGLPAAAAAPSIVQQRCANTNPAANSCPLSAICLHHFAASS